MPILIPRLWKVVTESASQWGPGRRWLRESARVPSARRSQRARECACPRTASRLRKRRGRCQGRTSAFPTSARHRAVGFQSRRDVATRSGPRHACSKRPPRGRSVWSRSADDSPARSRRDARPKIGRDRLLERYGAGMFEQPTSVEASAPRRRHTLRRARSADVSSLCSRDGDRRHRLASRRSRGGRRPVRDLGLRRDRRCSRLAGA